MTLKDKTGNIVLNKNNEEGKIIEVNNYIYVDFGNRIAKFKLDAFITGFLRFANSEFQLDVEDAIKEVKIEEEKKKEEEKIASLKAKEEKAKAELYKQRHKYPNENMVFRSQICDGGTLDYSNWFKAPCSKYLQNYHILEDRHSTWCNRCSTCKKVIEGNATIQDINDEYNNNSLCYESKILLDQKIKAGWDTDSNGNQIRPRSWNLKDDHLVILMTVEPGKMQNEAIIYSVFLSSQTTQASENFEASTRAAGNCFIDLTIEEARQMKLWEYMPSVAGDNPTFWGSGLFRYVSDDVAARILYDIVEIVKKRNNKEDTKKALLFLNNFLDSFGGDINNIPPKNGALNNS